MNRFLYPIRLTCITLGKLCRQRLLLAGVTLLCVFLPFFLGPAAQEALSGGVAFEGLHLAVTAPEELRVKRIMAREGISEEYAWMRVNAQHKSAWFQERCDHTLESTEADTVETFAQRARTLFRRIMEE